MTKVEKKNREQRDTSSGFLGTSATHSETFALLRCVRLRTPRDDKYSYKYPVFGPVHAHISLHDNRPSNEVDVSSLLNRRKNTNLRGTSTSIAANSGDAFQNVLHSRMKKGIAPRGSGFVFANFGYSFVPTLSVSGALDSSTMR